MLERVSAKAESAASFFIRNFERPHRSTRALDPRFWQNRNAELSTASWWPGYLQHIRDSSLGNQQSSRDITSISSIYGSTLTRPNFESVASRSNNSYASARPLRSYTVSAQRQQKPQRIYDVFDLTEEIAAEVKDDEARNEHGNLIQWRRLQSENLQKSEAEQDEKSLDSDEFIDGEQMKASDEVDEPRYDQLEQPDDSWDLESSLASLVSPDRIIASPGSKPSKSAESSIEYDFERKDDNVEDQPAEDLVDSGSFVPEDKTKRRATRSEEPDPLSEERDLLFKHMKAKTRASEPNFDEVWRIFCLLPHRDAFASTIFRYFANAKDTRYLGRAMQAFKIIPPESKTEALYRKALDVELKRYQHRNAIDLAFGASVGSRNLLLVLLRHFVTNFLWNSAVELIRRNNKARQDVQTSTFAIHQEMVNYRTLISSCGDIPDLFSKVTSLAERLRSEDATLIPNRSHLHSLCKDLILECAWSTAVAGRITREGVLALIELGERFGLTDLHLSVLSTLFKDTQRGQKADIALFVYRSYRLRAPDEKINLRVLRSLLSICGDTKTEAHVYAYLLKEFETHCPKNEIFGAYQRVLTNCARQGQVDAVEHFLQNYVDRYGKPKLLPMLNPLIYVRAVSGDVTNARNQFHRIREEFGVEPNQICWNMLVLAHARSENDLSAFEVFNEMLGNGLNPDSYTYGTLLSVCANHADAEAAVDLLAEAREFSVAITAPMISNVVETCLANDDDRQALAFVYAATDSVDPESLTRLWNIMMRYYAFKGDTTSMLRTRKRMADSDIKPNDMTYAALISDLVSKKQTLQAIRLLRKMHFQEGLQVTLLHYSIILQGLVAEKNRDMAMVIYTEIKQRFLTVSASVDVAILNLQGQRDPGRASRKTESLQLDFLSSVFAEASRQYDFPNKYGPVSKPGTLQAVWFQVLESLSISLIRNGSYDQAEALLDNLTSSQWLETAPGHDSSISKKLLLAKMDLAIAREKWDEVRSTWETWFQDAKRRYKPLELNALKARRSTDNDNEDIGDTANKERGSEKSPTPVGERWRFALSDPLNRYITSMSSLGRLDELWKFIQNDFRPAGFELSGRNWNRYIQTLCQSREYAHRIIAFRLTEQHLINRAQNWTLLTRGLLRQRQTKLVLKASQPGKRPLLQKQNSFTVSDRDRLLRMQPSRKIPTYFTFVHLAKVLQQADKKAKIGKSRLISAIGGVAPKTKRFLQQMPFLRDRFQGIILRDLPPRPDDERRPRSELSLRRLADSSGILGSKSPLDHLPAELLLDIEALVAPGEDVRQVVRRSDEVTMSPQQQRDIAVGEEIEGQVNRGPIVLAAQGRLEKQRETHKRVAYEERQRLRTVSQLRKDIRTRRLVEDSYRGIQDTFGIPVIDASDASTGENRAEQYSQLLTRMRKGSEQQSESPASESLENQYPAIQDEQSSKVEVMKFALPFEKLSVPQQMERLEAYRNAIAERSRGQPPVPDHLNIEDLALPYASIRRVRRALVKQQRSETNMLLRLTGLESYSHRASKKTWHSSRQRRQRSMYRQRRIAVLLQERALRAGQRLRPRPKSRRGVRRSRDKNFPNVRFVADLNRKKWRYQVRRGLMPDLRLQKFKGGTEDIFVSAEELIRRRHPGLIRLSESGMAPRRRRPPEPAVVALGSPKPIVKGNFRPVSEI